MTEELCHDPIRLFEFPNCCQPWNVEITIVSFLLLQKMLMKQENRQ